MVSLPMKLVLFLTALTCICAKRPCPEKKSCHLDLSFVLDSSECVQLDNFNLEKTFSMGVVDSLKTLKISGQSSERILSWRLALLQYSSYVETKFTFSKELENWEVKRRIQNLNYIHKGSQPIPAINTITNIYKEESFDCSIKVVLLLINERGLKEAQLSSFVTAAKENHNINIITVGIKQENKVPCQLASGASSRWHSRNCNLQDEHIEETIRNQIVELAEKECPAPITECTDCKCTKGEEGMPGGQGMKGPPGHDGRPGTDGLTGEPGLKGPPGRDGEPGIEGPKGDTGDRGKWGIQGIRGDTGPPGPGGPKGMKGHKGGQGPPGDKGPEGMKGKQGKQGNPGAQGPKGDTGRGELGPPGEKGHPGFRGAMGPPGEDMKGDTGERGPTGFAGDMGPPGDGVMGDTGANGYRGPDGPNGDPGLGLPGPMGERGPTGFPGAMGPPGDAMRGDTGKEGPVGPPGYPGPEGEGMLGPQGPDGYPGEPGPEGKDGAPGAPGLQGGPGADGVDGRPGHRGEDGAPGPKGETGPQGPTGAMGQPGEGTPGDKGDPGPTGERGSPGSQGRRGPDGATGKPGAPGRIGKPGPRGQATIGSKGETGPEGPRGPPGITGRGVTGDKGERGDHGLTGLIGPPGRPGWPGEVGPHGLNGLKGEPGPEGKGFLGPQGASGYRGYPGKVGPRGKGEIGAPGKEGSPGPQGAMGPEGRGIVGKQGEEGMAGLMGPMGLPGHPGVGDMGGPGLQGMTGPRGDVGDPGSDGPPGDRGTPGPEGPPGLTREIVIKTIREICGCGTPCVDKKMDLVFIVDGSCSIGEERFEMVQEFVTNLVDRFTIGPSKTRIGLVFYSHDVTVANVEFNLDRYMTKDRIRKHIKNMSYTAKGTHTGTAIRLATREVFSNAREGVRKVAIVITDGQTDPNEPVKLEDAVREAHRDHNIDMHVVGIHPLDSMIGRFLNELNLIASDPDKDHVHHIEDFNLLSALVNKLLGEVCSVREDTSTPFSTYIRTVRAPLVSTPAQTSDPRCNLPMKAGECHDYKISWFYHNQSNTCMYFYYGGCNGNDNRFETQEECTNTCTIQKRN